MFYIKNKWKNYSFSFSCSYWSYKEAYLILLLKIEKIENKLK